MLERLQSGFVQADLKCIPEVGVALCADRHPPKLLNNGQQLVNAWPLFGIAQHAAYCHLLSITMSRMTLKNSELAPSLPSFSAAGATNM